MGRLGVWELLIIFAVLLLLFGATQLPKLGASLGSGIRNFKKGLSDETANPDGVGALPTAAGAAGSAGTKTREKAAAKPG